MMRRQETAYACSMQQQQQHQTYLCSSQVDRIRDRTNVLFIDMHHHLHRRWEYKRTNEINDTKTVYRTPAAIITERERQRKATIIDFERFSYDVKH
jgi:hypothetical protein